MPLVLFNYHCPKHTSLPPLQSSSFHGYHGAERGGYRVTARVSRTAVLSSSSWENQTKPRLVSVSNNHDNDAEIETPPSGSAAPLHPPSPSSASEVVRNFYAGVNRHDLSSVEGLIGENCVYEDLVFPNPFVGRKDIIAFFRKFTSAISTDLQFVIDDISEEDISAVGVTWHLEWKGKPFPFSKGCSFYRLEEMNGTRQIIYARDCVEPAIKPGESTLVIIGVVAWLLQRFPSLVKWL